MPRRRSCVSTISERSDSKGMRSLTLRQGPEIRRGASLLGGTFTTKGTIIHPQSKGQKPKRLRKSYRGTLRGAELSAPPESVPNTFNNLREGVKSAELKLR